MSFKIPCGGFYLSDTLGVDKNGRLGVNGGEPYKSLVTDGEGNAKWEDRLAYEEVEKYSLPYDTNGLESAQIGPYFYYKVSDDLPDPNDVIQGAIYGGPDGSYLEEKVSDGYQKNETCLYDTIVGLFIICYQTSITFFNKTYSVPSTGVYFVKDANIIGDGVLYLQVQHVNTIDKKFLPEAGKFVVDATNLPSDTTGWGNLSDSLMAALDAGAEIFLDVYGGGGTLLKLTNADSGEYLFIYPKSNNTVSAYILEALKSDGGKLKSYDIYTHTGTT